MADITMCKGKMTLAIDKFSACPMRETCYRHRAIPGKHQQSYLSGIPLKFLHKDPTCDFYWRIPDENDYALPLAPFIE